MPRLLNALAAVSRLIILAALALFTLAVIVLALSALRSPDVTLPIKGALAAVAVAALARPRDGLLAAAGLAPFGQIGARILGTEMRGAEAVILAALSGALVRGWWSGRVRKFPSGPLESGVLLFGVVLAASMIEALWFLQIQRNFPYEFLADLGTYVGTEYLLVFRGLGMIHNAMLLVEGMALMIWSVDCCKADAAFRTRLAGMLVFSAAAAAVLNPALAVQIFIERGSPWEQVVPFMLQRWTVHVGDVNAAGSYFVLMIFLAGGLVATRARGRLGWIACAVLVGVGGVWLTGSRTAFVALVLALLGLAVVVTLSRRGRALRVALASAALTAPIWMILAYRLSYRSSGTRALSIRLHMLDSAARMVAANPLFGVGIGQYSLWSRHYASPELLKIYRPRDNAHNNFAQIVGETGMVGFLPFLWVLGVALWKGLLASRTDLLAGASMLGLAAFLITCLGGHPLLVPGVTYAFWIVLGLAAGAGHGLTWNAGASTREPPTGRGGLSARVPAAVPLALSAVLLLGSVPARVDARMAILDLEDMTWGFYDWERGPAGEDLRWTGPRARFFVAPGSTAIVIPLRAAAVSRDNPLIVDVVVDGQTAGQARLENSNWQTIRLPLPPSSEPLTIDILPSRSWIPAEVFEGSNDGRRLGVQVGRVAIEPANGGT